MAIEVFNRYENKYLIYGEDTLSKFQLRLSEHTELDEYNKQHETYKITNLYYDTDDSLLIRTSLSKPKYKEKLRVRAYDVPEMDSMVYAEIKKKVAGLVNKRRSSMKLSEAYAFMERGYVNKVEPYMNSQVISEIECMLTRYALKPAVYISYERKAYFGTGNDDVRVSFDCNITARRTHLRLEAGCFGDKLLPDGVWLMEVKVRNSIPVWLSQLLSEYKIFPVSFSKYGTEYKKWTLNQRKEKVFVYSPNTEAGRVFGLKMPAYG